MTLKDKVQQALDRTDLDEKLAAKAGEIKEKVVDAVTDPNLDLKVKAGAQAVKDKAQELLDKTDLDEKLAAKAKELKDKLK